MSVRRYIAVVQDARGYLSGTPDLAPPEGPEPPMVYSVVRAEDYEEVERERDRYRQALALLADPQSWGGNPRSHDAVLYGHDTPYELANRTLHHE